MKFNLELSRRSKEYRSGVLMRRVAIAFSAFSFGFGVLLPTVYVIQQHGFSGWPAPVTAGGLFLFIGAVSTLFARRFSAPPSYLEVDDQGFGLQFEDGRRWSWRWDEQGLVLRVMTRGLGETPPRDESVDIILANPSPVPARTFLTEDALHALLQRASVQGFSSRQTPARAQGWLMTTLSR